jgi:hypothetical protein
MIQKLLGSFLSRASGPDPCRFLSGSSKSWAMTIIEIPKKIAHQSHPRPEA